MYIYVRAESRKILEKKKVAGGYKRKRAGKNLHNILIPALRGDAGDLGVGTKIFEAQKRAGTLGGAGEEGDVLAFLRLPLFILSFSFLVSLSA